MEEVDEPEIVEIASAGRTDLLSLNLLSLSLTDADGDPKSYEKNVNDTMAGFLDLRDRRLADYIHVFKLVSADDCARARRLKVFAFFRENMTRENLHQAGQIHQSSHECLVLIDEIRELIDRLLAWLTLCLPANDHPLSVSHRQKLLQFQSRLAKEAVRLERRRGSVTWAHSLRVQTLRSMFRVKDVPDKDIPAWEKGHYDLLTMQETETYLSMCHVWLKTMDSVLILFNYWKVNLKDDAIAFGSGEKGTGAHDFFL